MQKTGIKSVYTQQNQLIQAQGRHTNPCDAFWDDLEQEIQRINPDHETSILNMNMFVSIAFGRYSICKAVYLSWRIILRESW